MLEKIKKVVQLFNKTKIITKGIEMSESKIKKVCVKTREGEGIEWHTQSTEQYKFVMDDVVRYRNETKDRRNPFFKNKLNEPFKEWLRKTFGTFECPDTTPINTRPDLDPRSDEWHGESSTGGFRFTKEDYENYKKETGREGVESGSLTDEFKDWLRDHFQVIKTPRFLKHGQRDNTSKGTRFYYTDADLKEFHHTMDKRPFIRKVMTKDFEEWLIKVASGEIKTQMGRSYKPIIEGVQYEPVEKYKQVIKEKTSPTRSYSASELKSIKEELSKYGAFYMPLDIIEDISDIIGEEEKKVLLDDFFIAFKEFNKYTDILKSENLFPSFSFLMVGASGTGKTTLVRAYAKRFSLPLLIVESHTLISGLLGSTLSNINKVISSSAKISEKLDGFILFFDEIDALGSERAGFSDVSEMKRATITLMEALDRTTYEGKPLAIFGATNHQSLLDKALWRRFTWHVKFDFPDYEQRNAILMNYLYKYLSVMTKMKGEKFHDIGDTFGASLADEHNDLYRAIHKMGLSKQSEFSEDIDFWSEISKEIPEESIFKITYGYTGADIERAFKNLLFRSVRLNLSELNYSLLKEMIKKVGGTLQKEKLYEEMYEKYRKRKT